MQEIYNNLMTNGILPSHVGTIMSGVLEQPIPQNIVYGKTVQTALQLMLASQGYFIYQIMYITLYLSIPTTVNMYNYI